MIYALNDAHTFPHTIQCNGEFYVGQLNVWYNQNGIHLIRSNPYTPNSNGKVERMNREIFRKMKTYFYFVRKQLYLASSFITNRIQNSFNS